MILRAQTDLPESVYSALQNSLSAKDWEPIRENLEIARKKSIPLCQDTGIPIFFVKGIADADEAIRSAYSRAAKDLPMSLHFQKKGGFSAEDLPVIYHEPGKSSITYLCKGIGAEFYSHAKQLSSYDEIADFIEGTVVASDRRACPPYFIGVGIGSSMDDAFRLAKKCHVTDTPMSKIEKSLLSDDAVRLKLLERPSPGAGLIVAVDIQCWANRFGSVSFARKRTSSKR